MERRDACSDVLSPRQRVHQSARPPRRYALPGSTPPQRMLYPVSGHRPELTRIARADGAAQMIIELYPLIEQPRIHAFIKPSFHTAHQYSESLHSPTETDRSLPGCVVPT